MSAARLLQFRAGRALRQGDSNTVAPQPDRGLVYLQQEDDGLLHFCYKDLATGHLEDDLIIFPGDAEFHKVNDRVHVLKFNSSSARHFYWHQDPDLDPEEFNRRGDAVNRLIGADLPQPIDTDDNQSALTTGDVAMSDTHAPEARSGSAATRTTATTTGAAPALGQAEQLAQLQNILAGLGGGGRTPGGMGPGGVPEYALTEVLPPSAAASLIASLPDSSLSLLASHLPSPSSSTSSSSTLATSTPAEQRASLIRAVSSPEFRRAVASLERALRTGATGPLVQGLGMPLRAANGTEEFLQEVQNQADRQSAAARDDNDHGGNGEAEAGPRDGAGAGSGQQ